LQDIESYRPFRKNRTRRLILWAGVGAIGLIVLAIIALVLFGPKESAGPGAQAATTNSAPATAQPATGTLSPPATSTATADTGAAAPVVDLASMTQIDRRAFVQKLIRQGVLTGVQVSPAPPKVGVTPLFQSLGLDLKRQFIAVVEAYVHNGATTTEQLQLIDATNGDVIGNYTVADGLKLS
jgi:hypothetical protein